jgi:hypothetical protein
MIALDDLIAINKKTVTIRDNFNRDSSCCKSRGGYVIHSGIHRSTAFVSSVEHPEGFESLEFWKDKGQAALNGWIVAAIADASLDDCEKHALQSLFPEWTFKRAKSDKFKYVKAVKGKTTVGGIDWRDLYSRLS